MSQALSPMQLLAAYSYQLQTIRPAYLNWSISMRQWEEQGLFVQLKNSVRAGVIVFGSFAAIDYARDKIIPDSWKNRIEPLILPTCLAATGLISALAHKTYHLSSSWFIKYLGLFLQIQSETYLLSFVGGAHYKMWKYLQIKDEQAAKIILLANVIATPFSLAVGEKMTRAGFDPISSNAASAGAFAAVSIVAFPIFAGIGKLYNNQRSSSLE